jgi:hypothetical protein
MRRRLFPIALFCFAILVCVALLANLASSATSISRLYNCVKVADQTKRTAAISTTVCPAGYVLVSWGVTESATTTTIPGTTVATTTTAATTTTVAATTTVATTTPTTQPTTTTTQPAGGFLSYPHQSGRQSFSGSNVVVSNRSYVGFTAGACLTVSNAVNVTIHDVDFDGCGGGIYLVDVTGNISISAVRARNTGNGNIGSGQGNVIQLSRSFDNDAGVDISNVKAIGGDTEDMISIYQSGGIDASHPLILEDIHLESPLPPDPNAWSSGSGTCVNLADSSGHDTIYRASTALNCGQVGEQINHCSRCTITNTIVYGAQRAGSNVGISRYGSCTCSGNVISNNRVWWKNASGSMNNFYNGSPSDTTASGNTFGDTTINPATLHVVL